MLPKCAYSTNLSVWTQYNKVCGLYFIMFNEDNRQTNHPGTVQPKPERDSGKPIRSCTLLGRGGNGHDTDKPKILIEYDL